MAKFCINCGHEIPDGVAFCTECGTPAQKDEKSEKKPSAEAPSENVKPVAAPPENGSSPKPSPAPQQTQTIERAAAAQQTQTTNAPPPYNQAPPPYNQYTQNQGQYSGYQPQNQPYNAQSEKPAGGIYGVVSTGAFFGLQLLFALPFVGWIVCIIMAFASNNQNIKNFAKAMLIWIVIGIVCAVAGYFIFTAFAGYLADYLNEGYNSIDFGSI